MGTLGIFSFFTFFFASSAMKPSPKALNAWLKVNCYLLLGFDDGIKFNDRVAEDFLSTEEL
jgi:hypothetical protein